MQSVLKNRRHAWECGMVRVKFLPFKIVWYLFYILLWMCEYNKNISAPISSFEFTEDIRYHYYICSINVELSRHLRLTFNRKMICTNLIILSEIIFPSKTFFTPMNNFFFIIFGIVSMRMYRLLKFCRMFNYHYISYYYRANMYIYGFYRRSRKGMSFSIFFWPTMKAYYLMIQDLKDNTLGGQELTAAKWLQSLDSLMNERTKSGSSMKRCIWKELSVFLGNCQTMEYCLSVLLNIRRGKKKNRQ